MKQQNLFCRLGPVFLALSITLSGCEYPTETIYIKVPVETPIEVPVKPPIEDPEEETPSEQLPGITDFTFTPVNPLRAAYAVKGKPVGRISNPVGGIAPFTYALASGDGNNDMDNSRFTVSGDLLQIQADSLAAGVYSICLKVTDNKGIFYTKAVTATIAQDPAALDQEARIIEGISFKMRYVPSGAFIVSGSMASIPMGFWMGETEVTQEFYQLIMGENPSHFKDNPAPGEVQANRPVDSVSWYEALLFCNRLSVISGREPVYRVWDVDDADSYLEWAFSTESTTATSNIYIYGNANGYRLPTKEEWIWAAIGADIKSPGQVNVTGTSKHYSGGLEEVIDGIENFSWYKYNSSDKTHEVGLKLGNELGIFDMTGNISEWLWGMGQSSSYWLAEGVPFSSFMSGQYYPYVRFPYCGIRVVSNQ